jgi:hypothetical protein
MPTKDKTWETVYVAAATELSNTFGSSTGTSTPINMGRAIGIEFMVTGLTLAAGKVLYLTPEITDKDSVTTYPQRRDGEPARQSVTAESRQTSPFWFNSDMRDGTTEGTIGVEPWLNAADATAAVTVKAKRIYPDR